MTVLSLGWWVLRRKCGQPKLLHEPEERGHSKWALLSRESWGPISISSQEPASRLSAHSRQWGLEEEIVIPRLKRVVTVHVSPGLSGETSCPCLPGGTFPPPACCGLHMSALGPRAGLVLWSVLTEEILNHTSVPFPSRSLSRHLYSTQRSSCPWIPPRSPSFPRSCW